MDFIGIASVVDRDNWDVGEEFRKLSSSFFNGIFSCSSRGKIGYKSFSNSSLSKMKKNERERFDWKNEWMFGF